MPDKQQVVFITRVLSGGGAERVVYDLAHHLDKDLFEVHVVCLFEQQSNSTPFDPRISIHCIAPTVPESASPNLDEQPVSSTYSTRDKLYYLSKKIYRFLVPTSIRLNLKLEERLTSLLTPHSPPASTDFSPPSSPENSELDQVLNSIRNIMPSILALQQVLTKFRKDAILMPVMEEATVRVWLSQLFQQRVYIASLHSVESYNMRLIYPNPSIRAGEEWLFANACRAAALVTVPSDGCRQDLTVNYGISPEHIQVVPNPVDTHVILQKSELPLQNVPDKQKTFFVYVGRLDLDKNPGLLIDAAYLLKKRYSHFVIYYVGKGALHSELSLRIEEKGLQDNIVLLGAVPNPFPYMKKSRALILTSHVESFALVLVEAMLCGTVPISVDCPHGPREVLDHGKYGILVPPNDPQALADAMWQIAQDHDLYSKLRKLGPERGLAYDISRIISDWESLLSTIHDQQNNINLHKDLSVTKFK